jgi:hypothetical protein
MRLLFIPVRLPSFSSIIVLLDLVLVFATSSSVPMRQEGRWCAFIKQWLDKAIRTAQHQSRAPMPVIAWSYTTTICTKANSPPSDPSRCSDSYPTKKQKIAGDPFYESAGFNTDMEILSKEL